MKKGIYFLLVLVTCCWYSCGTPSQEAQGGDTTTVQEGNNSTETVKKEGNTTEPQGGASKITDAIVNKVCDCKRESKNEDGTTDVERIRSCMGASSSGEYVANLLGTSATKKEIADAQKELLARTANCPD